MRVIPFVAGDGNFMFPPCYFFWFTLIDLPFIPYLRFMIDKLKKTLLQASEAIKEQANTIGESAKEKSLELIENWMKIFPELEELGFEVVSFGVGISISPVVEIEFKSPSENFPLEKVTAILKKQTSSSPLAMVFKTLKTTIEFREKMNQKEYDMIYLLIKVKIAPEVKVVLGTPTIY